MAMDRSVNNVVASTELLTYFRILRNSEEKTQNFVCNIRENVKKILKNKKDYDIISLVFKGVFIS